MAQLKTLLRIGLLFGLYALTHGPAWSADALAEDMKMQIEKTYPNIFVKIETSDDRLDLYENEKVVSVIYLSNLRKICQKSDPATCLAQKKSFITMNAQLLGKIKDDDFSRQNLRLVVRPADYKKAIESQLKKIAQSTPDLEKEKLFQSVPFLRSLGNNFFIGWAQDSPVSMMLISEAQMKKHGLSVSEMDEIGSTNLMQEKIIPIQPASKEYPSIFATHGNDYLSSVLVSEPFWKKVGEAYSDKEVAICLPKRDELFVYIPELDPAHAIDFSRLCSKLAQDAAVTFSDVMIRRVGGKWLLN